MLCGFFPKQNNRIVVLNPAVLSQQLDIHSFFFFLVHIHFRAHGTAGLKFIKVLIFRLFHCESGVEVNVLVRVTPANQKSSTNFRGFCVTQNRDFVLLQS